MSGIVIETAAAGAATVGRWPALALARTRALLPGPADLASMRRHPRRDLVAGVTVAVVALPLALAFGISSGRGAEAGLVTAVVAGFIAAALGGSDLQVSGPTGAMTVVLVPIVAQFGAGAILVVGMLAGVMLLGLAYARAGRYIRYIPLPVIEGFTVGIAVIIAAQQIPAAFGTKGAGEKVVLAAADAVGHWLAAPDLTAPAIAFGVAGAMLLAARFLPSIPMSLVAVAAVTGVVAVAGLPVATIGAIPAGLPFPSLPAFDLATVEKLLLPAVAVAGLGALESLMSASVADGMSVGARHDSDRELFGQGIANVVVPLFGGVPATAAIARTAVNVRSGAVSRLAAITHAVVLLAVVLVAAPLVGAIPLAALAGVLIATAIQMVEVSSLAALLRTTRGDAVVFLVSAGATILLDLVTAVLLGMIVAGAIALRQLADSAELSETALDHADHTDEERALFEEHIVAYRLDGPLFFGAAHTFLLDLAEVSDVRVVILRLSRVTTLDATGASVLADVIRRLRGRGIAVLLSGIRDDHAPVFLRQGVHDAVGDGHVFARTPDAIAHARDHVSRSVRETPEGDSPA